MALHKKAILGEIHKVHNWEYPNATARSAASGFTAEDIGKVAWQKDNDSFWFLKSNSPVVWQSFANDPSIITEQDLIENIRTAGVVTLPTFVYNNDGTCTIGTGQYSLYDNPNYQGVPRTFIINGADLSLTDNSANYILASYNSGTPAYEVVTSVPPTNTTDSDRIPVYSIYRSGNDVHYFDWDHLALGLAEKLNQRIRRTDRFRIDNGLGLSEVPTRTISVTSGQVWAGANIISLDSITSSSPETHFYYHTAGNWTRGNLSQYNNLQYDDGNNLVTLTNNKYAVNWIYRSVQQVGAIYVLLGNGDYSLIEAQSSKEPAKPTEISTQAILVGRIIVLKGANTATQIDRVIDVTFGANSVANHNDLSGIQGGVSNEYYHLSQAQNTFVDNLDNVITTDGTKIGIGITAPLSVLHVNKNTSTIPSYDTSTNESAINISAEDNRVAKFQTFAFNSGSNTLRFNYARGSASAPLYPTTLSSLGSISWRGWDENTNTWLGGATIAAQPDADWNATTRDTAIRFFTTKGTTAGEKVRISSSGNLLIGTTTDDTIRKLQVNGSGSMKGIALSTRTVTANTTATVDDYTIRCDATLGIITIALPAANSVIGSVIVIKKTDSSLNITTLVPNGLDTIDGQSSVSLYSQYDAVTVQSNGASWDVI